MEHKLTTLQDGHEISYYPSTYANVVKRQHIEESVETSLQRLEYFNKTISSQDKEKHHLLLSYDNVNKELKLTNLEVWMSYEDIFYIKNGQLLIDSKGNIQGNSLILSGVKNSKGKALTLDDNNLISYREPKELLNDMEGAPLDSPNFIGTPTAPTVDLENYSTQLATTQFTHDLIEFTNRDWGFIKIDLTKWSENLDDQNYYTQTIAMIDMKQEYKPIFNLIVSNSALEPLEKEGFFNLGGITTYNGYIVVRTQTKPKVDLFLQVKGI